MSFVYDIFKFNASYSGLVVLAITIVFSIFLNKLIADPLEKLRLKQIRKIKKTSIV